MAVPRPIRGNIGLVAAILVLMAFVGACTYGLIKGPAPTPWTAGLPEGGNIVYQADRGLGFCGMTSCPVRIVDVHGTCITEYYYFGWVFHDSKPCTGIQP